ncbi:MAG: cobaltochelatase subunit CobN [Rhodopseudomonas palustris]|nr:cobaltochelatase subunit CobN [Rhodopseudomonas palustris]
MLAARVAQAGGAAPQPSAPSARSRVVLFNFPPNAGNTGTAAFLSVFESLYNTLQAMQRAGLHGRRCRRASTRCANAIIARQRRAATAPTPTCTRASRPTTTCGASAG